jgi:hypothetical protein
MRRLTIASLLLALFVLAPAGCKSRKKARNTATVEDGQLVSVVNTGDPRAAAQLVRGFHAIENDAWRWAMKSFVVSLRRPTGAAQNGARLELKFVYPEVVFKKAGATTISATINGVALPPETYSAAGEGTYARDIPATALTTDPVTIEFSVDKAIPPGDQDLRELAIVVTSVGLLPK